MTNCILPHGATFVVSPSWDAASRLHATFWPYTNYHGTTAGVRVHLCEDICLSEHDNISYVYVGVCALACLPAHVSTYPFVHVSVIWCVWCEVLKHICLPAISFAYFSLPVHWVSGSLMRTVFHWQLRYSWSPTVMARCVAALAGRHRAHLENDDYTCVMVCVRTHL